MIKTISKLSMGTANLNALLHSQNRVFNKAGIGFQKGFPKKVKKFNSFFCHGSTSYSSPVTCFYCLERGHTVRQCKTRLYDLPKGLVKWVPKGTVNMNGPKINRGPTLATQLVLQGLWIAKKQLWYLDSGCSKHMTEDTQKFNNLKMRQEGFVTYGDNNKGRILGKGDVGSHDSIIIKDVLLVDGLKHNLLSISQLCDKGYEVTFKPDLCQISQAFTRQTLLIGKRVNNMYMLNICNIASSMTCLLSKNHDSWLWYRRLTHIHMHHLDRLVSKNLVEGLPTLKYEKDRICEACQKGKQNKNIFKSKNFVSILDPLSCFTWIYLVLLAL